MSAYPSQRIKLINYLECVWQNCPTPTKLTTHVFRIELQGLKAGLLAHIEKIIVFCKCDRPAFEFNKTILNKRISINTLFYFNFKIIYLQLPYNWSFLHTYDLYKVTLYPLVE